ncbi:ABC transporter substrate-binding protein [Alicyclobacillus mengziensis]|uniref:ABC transporter substrate-binding protein n=1 Tax=Alicyclobacillus mengziensis TaxID=2931921 RepID=A0A9X7VYL9_9BACL|nr:ABC transporter substrate-binding protein [Alicyclobacillus mengziensis]QSO47503.1 ABC transporter substrate-binding protein [Alicyclobacillus mengziensis]
MKKSVFIIPTVLTALTLGVAGCGTNTASGNANAATTSTGSSVSTANQASSSSQATTAASASFPVTLKDGAGHTVTISKQPQRIASTTEGTDEILTALVPKQDIVLVTSYADNPQYSNVTSLVKGIPTIQNLNAEQVIAVKPDLVLTASYAKQSVVSQIEQAGIPTYEFNNFNSIEDIERNIEIVGKLVGQEAKAVKVVTTMQSQLHRVENAVKGQKKVKVLDYSSYGYAAGSSTTVNDVIVDAGGINAAAKLNGWQQITDEEIVKLNPNVIIDANNDKGFVHKILSDPALKDVSAVKNHRVYSVNSADLTSVSQYVIRGVQDVAKLLYPNVQIGNE